MTDEPGQLLGDYSGAGAFTQETASGSSTAA
jgi:hypothetical protein